MSANPTLDPLAIAADLLDPPVTGVLRYYNDPAGFATDCIRWEPGTGPTHYQLRNLADLVRAKRLATVGPHGLGKTAENAWAILWFALTSDAAGIDWKCPTTASVWRQLSKYLWPEVHKWARRLDWDKIGREPFNRFELLTLNLKLNHGEAFALASDDPTAIEGVHADRVLYIYDEAKAIPDATFDATEGAFSGAGDEGPSEAFALISSTPGTPAGRLYDIARRAPGYEDWTINRVTLADTIKAGRVTREWAEQRRKQWGENSAVYRNRVLGEFAASDEDSIIPLAWVEAANERWRAMFDGDDAPGLPDEFKHLDAIGVDPARSGDDRTVFALRHGPVITELIRFDSLSTMETTGELVNVQGDTGAVAIVDVIGIGAGVVDRLVELGRPVEPFNAAQKTDLVDSSGQLMFANRRAAAWWNLRELLDPERGMNIALPPDDRLTGDLTAPKWKTQSSGRILIEAKADIRKRIGRSTDDGDAVVQAFWPGETTATDMIVTERPRIVKIGPNI